MFEDLLEDSKSKYGSLALAQLRANQYIYVAFRVTWIELRWVHGTVQTLNTIFVKPIGNEESLRVGSWYKDPIGVPCSKAGDPFQSLWVRVPRNDPVVRYISIVREFDFGRPSDEVNENWYAP
jgi:hypothetical protein